MLDILQTILSLVVIKGERSYPSGTASIVGRRLAMTAKHVIDDYLNQFGAAGSGDEFLGADVFGLQYQAADDSGVRSIASRIRVVKLWRSALTDIAFLELDTEFPRRLPLSVLPTALGHRTHAIGFHQSGAVVSSKAVELPESVRAKLYTHETHGKRITTNITELWDLVSGSVTHVYPERRDESAMGNFPCFYIDTRFEPGMSGGPVLNHEHGVCGVVSSGMTFGDSGGGLSLAAIVAPALQTMIDLDYPGRSAAWYPVFQLAKDNYIRVDHLDHVVGTTRDTGASTRPALRVVLDED